MFNSNPDSAISYIQRGRALIDIGDSLEALNYFRKALVIAPDNYEAMCLAASSHFNLGEKKEALKLAQKAAAINPNGEWAYRLRALTLLKLGKARKAYEHARIAARISPEDIDPLHVLGLAALCRLRYIEAHYLADNIIRRYPSSEKGFSLKGNVLLQERRYSEAQKYYLEALKKNPQDQVALEGQAQVAQQLDAIAASSSFDNGSPHQDIVREKKEPKLVSLLAQYFAKHSRGERTNALEFKLMSIVWSYLFGGLIVVLITQGALGDGYTEVLWLSYLTGLPLLLGISSPALYRQHFHSLSPEDREHFSHVASDWLRTKLKLVGVIGFVWVIFSFAYYLVSSDSEFNVHFLLLLIFSFPLPAIIIIAWFYSLAITVSLLRPIVIDRFKFLRNAIQSSEFLARNKNTIGSAILFLTITIAYLRTSQTLPDSQLTWLLGGILILLIAYNIFVRSFVISLTMLSCAIFLGFFQLYAGNSEQMNFNHFVLLAFSISLITTARDSLPLIKGWWQLKQIQRFFKSDQSHTPNR